MKVHEEQTAKKTTDRQNGQKRKNEKGGSAGTGNPTGTGAPSGRRENLRRRIEQYIEEARFYHDLPGLAVSVRFGDHGPQDLAGLTIRKAVGTADVKDGEPLRPDHIFHMASVSKLFTASGILLLCREGRLDLDERLADVLPEVSVAGKAEGTDGQPGGGQDERYGQIRIRHMLTHTSGLGDVEDYHWDQPRIDEAALADYACSAEVKTSRMICAPEENRFHYSNLAYELLGLIIARRSGMPYEAYMAEKLLQPLGMADSTFLTFERGGGASGQAADRLALPRLKAAGLAMPHTKNAEKQIVQERHYPYNRQHGPSSTLTSNLADLEKWARTHLEYRLFPPEVYEAIWKPYTIVPNNGEGMGLGWFMRRQKGYAFYGHEGTDDGFRASFWLCPQLDASIIVAANISRGAVKKINKKIAEQIICSVG